MCPSGRFFLLFLLLSSVPLTLSAQQFREPDLLEQEYRKESLKALALEEIAQGNYREALAHLDAAVALVPDDRDLTDLRQTVQDIIILEENRLAEETTEEPDFSEFNREDEDVVISPDFAADLLSEAQKAHPEVMRKAFYLDFGGAIGSTLPVSFDSNNGFVTEGNTLTHNYYSGFLRASYFFNASQRYVGAGLRYKAYPVNSDSVNMPVHRMDLSLHLRGYFSETMENRMILGARAGFGLIIFDQKDEEGNRSIVTPNVLVAGFYLEDALFRYLFKKRAFFRRIIFDLGFDFYFPLGTEDASLGCYNFAAGYRISDNWQFSIYNEVVNNRSSLENSIMLEGGFRVSFRY